MSYTAVSRDKPNRALVYQNLSACNCAEKLDIDVEFFLLKNMCQYPVKTSVE